MALPELLLAPDSAEDPQSLLSLLDGAAEASVVDASQALLPAAPLRAAARAYLISLYALHAIDALQQAAARNVPQALSAARGAASPLSATKRISLAQLLDDGDDATHSPPLCSDAEWRWIAFAANSAAFLVLCAVILAGVVRFREAYGYAWEVVEEFKLL